MLDCLELLLTNVRQLHFGTTQMSTGGLLFSKAYAHETTGAAVVCLQRGQCRPTAFLTWQPRLLLLVDLCFQ
jgi:hypothetical protein